MRGPPLALDYLSMGAGGRTTLDASNRLLLIVPAVAVLALVLVRCLVEVSPDIYWDVDPLSPSGVPGTALGPASSVWLNVLSVAVAAWALAAHVAVGGRINLVALLLTLSGMAACGWHGLEHAENLRRGSAWIAAAALALAGFHLAQHERPRRYIAAALVAMLVPLTLQAVTYIYVEHPRTVRYYEQNTQQIIESLGIELGSPMHAKYEIRLRSPDALGAFGLSNVLGSIAAGLTLLTAALALVWCKARQWRQARLPGLVAAGGLWTVYLTHSKGAPAAILGCAVLLAWVWWSPRARRYRYVLPSAAVLLLVGAVGTVLVRGAMGPTYRGELSILFRYHYWQGAAGAVGVEPVRNLTVGLGMEGFAQAYQVHKNPLSPESVDSTHNVFVDQVAMLGLGGMAWSVLLVWWLWRGGIAARDGAAMPATASRSPPPSRKRAAATPDDQAWIEAIDFQLGLLLAGVIFAFQFITEGRALLGTTNFLSLSFGAIGFCGVFMALVKPGGMPPGAASVGLFVAAAALLTHGQIEMTFFHEHAVVVAFFIVAAAAGGAMTLSDAKPVRRVRWLGAVSLAAVAVVMVVGYAVSLTQQQWTLKSAAEARRRGNQEEVMAQLDEAIGLLPIDPKPYVLKAGLLGAMPGELLEALATLDAAEEAGLRDTMLLQLRAGLLMRHGIEADLASTVAAWQAVLKANPYSLRDHLQLADLYWQMGRQDNARVLYLKCLDLDQQLYLEPVLQLRERELKRIRARLGQDPST